MPTPSPFAQPHLVEQAFYDAFRELDMTAMRRVWSPHQDSFCIHPGGAPLLGVKAVLQGWQEIFASAHPPRISYRLVETHGCPDLEVHLVEERIQPGGAAGKASLVMATNVYRRDEEGWRMVAHHASLPLVKALGKGAPRQVH